MLIFALTLFNWFVVKNEITKIVLAIITIILAEKIRKKEGSNLFLSLGEIGAVVLAILYGIMLIMNLISLLT